MGTAAFHAALSHIRARVHAIAYGHTTVTDAQDLKDAADLVGVLAHIVDGKTVRQAFGAPGDWGYQSNIGRGLLDFLSRDHVRIETKQYADGTTATGVAPLPDQSPAASLTTRLRAIEGREWEHTLTYNGVRLEAADEIERLLGELDAALGWIDWLLAPRPTLGSSSATEDESRKFREWKDGLRANSPESSGTPQESIERK